MPDPRGGWTLGALLAHARETLKANAVPQAGLDARLLVEHFARASRTELVTRPEQEVAPMDAAAVLEAIASRAAGRPVHRIIGHRDFHGLHLTISAGTLEPRPDTEALVELMSPLVRAAAKRHGECRILDLGTGTGALALALLAGESRAFAIGCDISEDALATARRNADINSLSDRFRTMRSDWLVDVDGLFHIIVSNPPYIPTGIVGTLQREVRDHDPHVALDGGDDGLDAYRVIARDAATRMHEDATIGVEIGFDQRDEVEAIFGQAGFTMTGAARDLAGHERALAFTRV